VRRQLPSSGKPGDKAIIQQDGKMIGWIGGGCTQGIVLKEAADAIRDGKPRLVRIKPEGETEVQSGVSEYKMTCYSGGAVEIYIEPVLPRPHLLIMGRSHVAMALSRLGKAMDYPVTVLAPEADPATFPEVDVLADSELRETHLQPNTCIVVCTQGERDEDALEQAIRSGTPYVAFVSSRRKASAIFGQLRRRGIDFDQLERVRTPAGLDIHAKLPEEVAVSILAEIIAFMRAEPAPVTETRGTGEQPVAQNDLFINPVCGIPVKKSTAKHVIHFQEEDYYFCCDGCKEAFEKEPEKYVV